MNTQLLAQKILDIKYSLDNPTSRQTAIRNLSEQEMNYALGKRWVHADIALSGMLDVTTYPALLESIRKVAGNYTPSSPKQPETNHSFSPETRRATALLALRSDPHCGIREDVSLTSSPQSAAPSPAKSTTKDSTGKEFSFMQGDKKKENETLSVGESVVVTSEGKSYTAKIRSQNNDGTYSLSFAGNVGNLGNKNFKRSELAKVAEKQV